MASTGATRARASAAAPRRRDEAKALFRNAILDAAEEVFAERGFHGARMQDVAERARIAVGTIYNHFPQKEDVLRALLEERTGELQAAFAARRDDPRAFDARLAARLERVAAYVAEHRAFFSLAIEHGLLGGATAAARAALGGKPLRNKDRFLKMVHALVDEGIAARVFERADRGHLVRLVAASIRAITLHTLDTPSAPVEVTVRAMLSLFFDGARRRPRARRS
jgi:AcrR family transcriptional regulator